MAEISSTFEDLKDAVWCSLSYLHSIHQDEFYRNRMDPGATLLEQIDMASDTWYMAINSASAFFSIPIRKEDQKQYSHEINNSTHLLFQPICLVT